MVGVDVDLYPVACKAVPTAHSGHDAVWRRIVAPVAYVQVFFTKEDFKGCLLGGFPTSIRGMLNKIRAPFNLVSGGIVEQPVEFDLAFGNRGCGVDSFLNALQGSLSKEGRG